MARTKKDAFNESLDSLYKFLNEDVERQLLDNECKIIEDGSIIRIVEDGIYNKHILGEIDGVIKSGWYPRICMMGAMEDMGFKYIGKLPSELQRWDNYNSCSIVGDIFECPRYDIADLRYVSVSYSIENMVENNNLGGRHYGYKHDEPLIRLKNIAYYNGAVL